MPSSALLKVAAETGISMKTRTWLYLHTGRSLDRSPAELSSGNPIAQIAWDSASNVGLGAKKVISDA